MAHSTETRDRIIQVGASLIHQHGFAASGLDTILKAAGVPKGSFYHYFPSKDDFGLAVIDWFATEYKAHISRFLHDPTASPLQRLRNFVSDGIKTQGSEACRRGCLIGNLGQELAGQNEAFRARLDRVFVEWEEGIADCMKAAQDLGEVAATADTALLARFFLNSWEGALLRAKLARSIAPLQEFETLVIDRLLQQ